MKSDNPFTLSFGKAPHKLVSRYEDAQNILTTFEAENPVSQVYMIQGIRGSGKTVLMTTISKELASHKEWVVIDLNSTQDLMRDFAMRLSDSHAVQHDLFESGFNVSVAGFGIGVNSVPTEHDYVSIIENILEEIKKKGKKLLITIDEVVHTEGMKYFASEFQIFLRKDYPIYLLMTGLYENIYAVQNDPALTFLLRTPKIHLEPLSMRRVAAQYKDIFHVSIDEAKHFAAITKGYAFAFQAFGMLYWEYGDTLSLDEIILKYEDMLDDFVYKKIWDHLSGQDREVVLSLSQDEMKVKALCESTGMTSSTFSKYRERLMKKGIIFSPRHGYLSLTLPRFYEVVKEYI